MKNKVENIFPKRRNPLAELSLNQTHIQYLQDKQNPQTRVYNQFGECGRLCDYNWEQVIKKIEFIGGAWRMQNYAPEGMTPVRDSYFVLKKEYTHDKLKKFPGMTCNIANKVETNCYGWYLTNGTYYVINYQGYSSYGMKFNQAFEEITEKIVDENASVIAFALENRELIEHLQKSVKSAGKPCLK